MNRRKFFAFSAAAAVLPALPNPALSGIGEVVRVTQFADSGRYSPIGKSFTVVVIGAGGAGGGAGGSGPTEIK